MSPLPLAILRTAAWLVRHEQRAEWLTEWSSELCYLSRCRGGAIPFCLGAFPDALWMRRNFPRTQAREWIRLESPLHCILILMALAAASVFLAFRLPVARHTILPSSYRDAQKLVMISPPGRYPEDAPAMAVEDYRMLAAHQGTSFAGVAFYQAVRNAQMPVALTSSNFFELLGIPISSPAPALVLSHEAWRKYFDADPRIVGRLVQVAGRRVRVGAVIADDLWSLPCKVEAWLIEDSPGLSALPARSKGFVVARLSASPPSQPNWRWDAFVTNGEGGRRRFECVSLAQRCPIVANLLMLAIALLILPAVTPWRLGDYPRGAYSCRRWIFLGVKIAILLPIAFFGTLDVASVIAMGLQPHGLLVGFILAFRWALVDQRRRCPVCLRLLTNPTHIGWASQILLEWYGTEFMCRKGHGSLHVPEIPSSCNGVQRWLALDPSWSSLFS